MTAQTYAALAKSAPTPAAAVLHGYTCHVAALHWMFRENGETEQNAASKLEGIARARCQGCTAGHHVHLSIPHNWYGTNMCRGATPIADMDDLITTARVGDVLLVGNPIAPSHSMVVVKVSSGCLGNKVHVRGFNNLPTLGTGLHNQYDNHDRNIAVNRYWHSVNQVTRFGPSFAAGEQMYRISYAQYYANSQAIRTKFDAQNNYIGQ